MIEGDWKLVSKRAKDDPGAIAAVVDGTTLVVLVSEEEVRFLDLRDPTRLEVIARYQPKIPARSIRKTGSRLLLSCDDGIEVVDCSRPGEPERVRVFEVDVARGSGGDIAGDRLYWVSGRNISSVEPDGDSKPVAVAVGIGENDEFFSDYPATLIAGTNHVYVAARHGGFYVYELETPVKASLVRHVKVGYTPTEGFKRGELVVLHGNDGVIAFDVSVAAKARRRTAAKLGTSELGIGSMHGSVLLAAGFDTTSKLRIGEIDLDGPKAPTLVQKGRLPWPKGEPFEDVTAVAIAGDRLVLSTKKTTTRLYERA